MTTGSERDETVVEAAPLDLGASPVGAAAPVGWADAPPRGWVDLRAAIPTLCLDIRYATSGNFTGAPLPGYEIPGAWLLADAAAALAKAEAKLREGGLGLLVYDAYRPRRASAAMVAWAARVGRHAELVDGGYIAIDSAHARGRTVDVGLCDPATGEPLDLGTDFDAFVPAARHGGVQGPPAVLRSRLLAAMRAAGFRPYAREWWHYALVTDHPAPAHDVPYAEAP